MESYEALIQRFVHTVYLIMLNIQNDCMVLFDELCPDARERGRVVRDDVEVEPLIDPIPVTIKDPSRECEWDIV